jgi:hypothetical protein
MNARLLGTLCIIGSIIGVANSLRLVMLGQPLTDGIQTLDTLTAMTMVVGAIAGLCGLLGFIALRATGNNPIFRLLTYLPGISYLAAIVGGLGLLTGLLTSSSDSPITVVISGLSDILNPVAWLVVAILTFAAKSWQGWRKFVPLALFLTFPLGIAVSISTGLFGTYDVIYYAATALLGYAVQSSAPAMQLREVTA